MGSYPFSTDFGTSGTGLDANPKTENEGWSCCSALVFVPENAGSPERPVPKWPKSVENGYDPLALSLPESGAGSVSVTLIATAIQDAVQRNDFARVLNERRPWLHINLDERTISAEAGTPQSEVAVMEIDPEGIRIATEAPIPLGSIFRAELTLNDGRRARLNSEVVYSNAQRYDGHVHGYVSRLAFLPVTDWR